VAGQGLRQAGHAARLFEYLFGSGYAFFRAFFHMRDGGRYFVGGCH
jgi:hypothetical protein